MFQLQHLYCLLSVICTLIFVTEAKVVNGKWVDDVLPTTVLITGCSSGIGLSTALEFAKNPKFKVWASMRDTSAWKDVPIPKNVVLISLDVTSDESVTSAVSKILQVDTKIDILVNNAGYGMVGTLETVHIEEAKKMFDVNVWGVVRVLQAVLPSMRKRMRGHVIGVSSTSGIRATPANDFYVGSKFALEGISEAMRYSLAAFNISVTSVIPGPVVTMFTSRYGKESAGGRGTREVDDPTGYLHAAADKAIASLETRMNGFEGQQSQEVAQVIVNVAHIGIEARKVTDVPFSVGTNRKTQALISSVRTNPTGWGGLYTDMMAAQTTMQAHTEEVTRQSQSKSKSEGMSDSEL